MIDWPQTIVREVARRRCIFFLGAGVSAAATNAAGANPKDWPSFLDAAADLVRTSAERTVIKRLIAEKKYLLALQAIKQEADRADYHGLLDECFNDPSFQPSELHQIIRDLDSRTVITTNFDKIYERLCIGTSSEGYKIIPYYSGSLGDELRSDTRLIIKAHGSIDDIQNMVFTKSEYHKAKRDYSHFYDMLKALFLTNTGVFIGCGLEDPDVLLMLEDVRITASAQKPHYALSKKDRHDRYSIKDLQDAYNIKVLEYEPDHAALTASLGELLIQVKELRATSQEG